MTPIRRLSAIVLLFLVVLGSPARGQQNDGTAPKAAPRARRIFTNDDEVGSQSDDRLPQIPGMIKCGKDVQCFLHALDTALPAAVTRAELVEVGTAIVTSDSTWWTSQCGDGRCSVGFRVDAFSAKVNEKVFSGAPKAARDIAEQKLAQMNRDFEGTRGKTATCSLAVKDLKTMMTPPAWSLMSLGSASDFGKSCSGPMFTAPGSPFGNQKE